MKISTGGAVAIGAGAIILIGGVRYGLTRNRLINNLVYRPEINFQKSMLQADKLILSVNLYVNNPTPNSITITKPTVTLRYPKAQRIAGQDEDVLFSAVASDQNITIGGNGQTTISDIRIEIVYTDAFGVGKEIIEKLLKCETATFKVDVAMTVDKLWFINKKEIKTLLIERKDLPTKLSKFLPPCDSMAGKLVTDILANPAAVFTDAKEAVKENLGLGRYNRMNYGGRT